MSPRVKRVSISVMHHAHHGSSANQEGWLAPCLIQPSPRPASPPAMHTSQAADSNGRQRVIFPFQIPLLTCMCLWVCVHACTLCIHPHEWAWQPKVDMEWLPPGISTLYKAQHLLNPLLTVLCSGELLFLISLPESYDPEFPASSLHRYFTWWASLQPVLQLLAVGLLLSFPTGMLPKNSRWLHFKKYPLNSHNTFLHRCRIPYSTKLFLSLTNKFKFRKWRTIWQPVLWPKMFRKQIQ